MKNQTVLKMEMGERMAKLEEKVDNIESMLKEFIKSADKRYCPSHIESIVSNNCKDIDNIKSKVNYYIGAIGLLLIIIQVIIAIYF